MRAEAIIETRGVGKSFAGFKALNAVSVGIQAGVLTSAP